MASVARKLMLCFLLCACILLAARHQALLATYWEELAQNYDPWIEGGILPVNLRTKQQQQQLSHDPRRFSSNTTLHVQRGLNVLLVQSPARISSWVYVGVGQSLPSHIRMDLTDGTNFPEEKFLRGPESASKMQNNDTLYVNPMYLQEFTGNFLPAITTEFVLLTDNWMMGYNRLKWMHTVAPDIVASRWLLKWFATNIHMDYTGGMERHPKVAPFPLGLKQNMPGAKASYRRPIQAFKAMFNETLHNPALLEKTTTVYAGYTHPRGNRKQIPRGTRRLPYHQYLREVAHAKYVISPDGDHPDCHRHYESIGLGAVPITELNPFFYRHLQEGLAIFNNTNWNMTDLEVTLPSTPVVNRNMIFEGKAYVRVSMLTLNVVFSHISYFPIGKRRGWNMWNAPSDGLYGGGMWSGIDHPLWMTLWFPNE